MFWSQRRKRDTVRHYWTDTDDCVLASDEITVPSKAEDEQGDAEEGGHGVPDQGAGMAGTEVETKPEGSSQGKQLTRQKIHLRWEIWGLVLPERKIK